ncbi:TPA: hypothetical protein NN553_004470 [Pseudomonas aeruginosa]|nr:hypothetical protein [Pseudomonas aeruginosa]HCJ0791305.1 hypothetical protein [Pseudomonas aeruginosa]
MSNELTDVRCHCGAEFPADSYDAGFIAGSGMCQNCDAAMPPKDIPALVEQAGGDERAAFEAAFAAMGRPVCRADYDQDAYGTPFDDGGWTGWQARAALAQPSPVRSSLLINGYQLRAALDFIAPDGTAEQLESEACIEWRQQDADFLEAGLYAFCAEYPEEGGVLLDEEPTTAQPSPLQSEQEELEQPVVVGYRSKESGMVYEQDYGLKNPEALMTVAQHERITGQLHDALDESDGDRWKLRSERDAAMARVAEYEAQAQHSVPGNAAALVRAEAKKYSLNAAGMLDSGAPEHAQTFAIVQLLSEFDDEEAESHWEAIMAYSDFRTSDALFRAAELLAAAPGKEGV